MRLEKKFKDGTELGQDLFARLADQSAIATIAETGVVRYESGKLFLNMYKDVDDPRGPGTGYFHEFGHQIDEKLGWEFTRIKKSFNFCVKTLSIYLTRLFSKQSISTIKPLRHLIY